MAQQCYVNVNVFLGARSQRVGHISHSGRIARGGEPRPVERKSPPTVLVDMFTPRAVAVTTYMQRSGGGNTRHKKKRHGTRSSLMDAKHLPISSRLLTSLYLACTQNNDMTRAMFAPSLK
jgi:hypothetical protein